MLPEGSGAIFCFGVKGGREAGRAFIEAVELLSHLANVGDAKSLVIHPASTTHQQMDAAALEAAGVGEDMVRLSIGLEDPDDLIADLEPRPQGGHAGGERTLVVEFRVDGLRVFAATGGRAFDPSLPVTVFVHGAAFDHTVWKLQARYFAWHGGSVLAVDLPGHGLSQGQPRGSIPEMADWLVALLDAAEVGQVNLVGHSMGALVALEAAARHGARVRKLALLGAAPAIPVNDLLLSRAAEDDHHALELLTGWGYGRRAHFGGHRMPGLWMTGGGLRTLERASPGVLHTDLVATNGYEGGEAAAAAVVCPVLVVIGARDLMTPAKRGHALARMLAASTTVVIPGAGHIMLDEEPDQTLDALRDFFVDAQ